MLSNRDYKKLHHLIQFAFFAVIILGIYLAFRYVFGIIAPFVIAFLAASIIEPLVRFMIKKLHMKRALASSICVVLLLGAIIGICAFISVFIWKEGKGLIENIPNYMENLVEKIKLSAETDTGIFAHLPSETIIKLETLVNNYDYSALFTGSVGSALIGYAGDVVEVIPNALIFLLVSVASIFFVSISFPAIKRFILIQFKPQHRELILEIKRSLFSTITKFIRSYSILMFATFAELLIFFLIFGFKPAFPLAFMIAFVDLLPVLGVGTVMIPWALFSLITGKTWEALILICIYIVISIVRQILEPKVIGDHVGIPPILTLIGIWVGLKLFGFLGMFIVPISIVILKELQDSKRIKLWNTEESENEKYGT